MLFRKIISVAVSMLYLMLAASAQDAIPAAGGEASGGGGSAAGKRVTKSKIIHAAACNRAISMDIYIIKRQKKKKMLNQSLGFAGGMNIKDKKI
jgi:opacity protein-like surface antigen